MDSFYVNIKLTNKKRVLYMSFSTNQRLKKLYILKILMENTDEENKMSIKDLILALESYGISAERKSIYTDIEDLQDFGIDIICEKGRSNYYYIGNRQFELAELKLLVDSVQASRFITHKKSNELIGKLQKLTSIHNAKFLKRQVNVYNRIKSMNEKIYYSIDVIHNAMRLNKMVEFKYYSYDVDKNFVPRRDGEIYRVIPYSLNWANEKYYLVGYYERYDEVSSFRVDRMGEARVSEEDAIVMEKYKDFDIVEYENKVFGMFGGDLETVEIEFENSMINIVIDKFGKDILIHNKTDTHFRITVDLAITNMFFSWLFIFGGKAKIIGPDKVKNQVKEYLEEIMDVYK